LCTCGPIREPCCTQKVPGRQRLAAAEYRRKRARRFQRWNQGTSLQLAV
jgi:hypothetical protein